MIKFKKLSKIKKPARFCWCYKCNVGYENDVNTNHALCPNCETLMQNMSKEALTATIEKESKTRIKPEKEIAQ